MLSIRVFCLGGGLRSVEHIAVLFLVSSCPYWRYDVRIYARWFETAGSFLCGSVEGIELVVV